MAERNVIVAGAVAIDWNLARIPVKAQQGTGRTSIHNVAAYPQWGGAAMLARLMEELSSPELLIRVHCNYEHELRIDPSDPNLGYHQSYAVWTRKPKDAQAEDPTVWRVEQMLGVHGRSGGEAKGTPPPGPPAADLVLIDDSDPGFRKSSEQWPEAVRAGTAPWVLIKMTRPVAEGDWWRPILDSRAARVVAVMTVEDLRLSGIMVSRGLSWEAALTDLAQAFEPGGKLAGLRDMAYVVVTFDTVGAFVYDKGANPPFYLVCDPEEVEGTWQRRFPGGMMGYTSCMAAELARELLVAPTAPEMAKAVAGGLRAQRALLKHGYRDPEEATTLSFPYKLVLQGANLHPGERDPFVRFQLNPRQDRRWSILSDRAENRYFHLAAAVALAGEAQLRQHGPFCSFGKMTTIDRSESENYRSLVALIEEYRSQPVIARPLSIAVFGAPGSGKSFGVSEVAGVVLGHQSRKLVFNLSQLQEPRDLIHALHLVRDESLSGRIPLVFWDEFDATLNGQAWGWLRYFLAPMQDGLFLDGQVSHPIGRAVFVFAGGTAQSIHEFTQNLDADDRKNAKVPDFVSRLKGFVDVQGPNPKEPGEREGLYMIRRAVLLRSILKRMAPHLFIGASLQIDTGVLNAFLRISEYRYGARSLEAILVMSRLAARPRFERSCLPSEPQLGLHVEANEFLRLTLE